ncbi:MAG: hypothetical protein K9N49_09515 [Candidatus Marinimicrobia bacterium]|nr:hypothetical protein [Candidatus Neomarinimicrobiota bacterium]
MNSNIHATLRAIPRLNFMLAVGLAAYFFFLPGLTVIRDLADPALRTDALPHAAQRLFRALTPRYARWAKERVAAGRAGTLSVNQIAATEWPLFGSVFYLWAVEELQADWERQSARRGPAPRAFARAAIEAATDLVLDPGHAAWVKEHWGPDYLQRENVFYRALLISAMTSHFNLTDDPRHLDFLRAQTVSLAAELDRSPHGLLDDYPGECYPTDVLMAIASIRRADEILGTDHTAFAARAIRGFQGGRLDGRGLPPYMADAQSGFPTSARGCGLSYACMSAPYLWPDLARTWYARYEHDFWQERFGLHGFREFLAETSGPNWYVDVDSGPVLGGIGVSASAFGVAASRILGRFDRAYPLSAQMIVFSWPLPNGALLTPRILSNAAHAPYLGEACILYNLTRRAAPGMTPQTGGRLPPIVIGATAVYFLLGLLFVQSEYRALRRWRKRAASAPIRAPRTQLAVWLTALATAAVIAVLYGSTLGAVTLLIALPFPLKPRG